MDYTEQGNRAARMHPKAFDEGKTCDDCHKGVHQLPQLDQHIGTRVKGAAKMSHGDKPKEAAK